jgi:hypothetical protein
MTDDYVERAAESIRQAQDNPPAKPLPHEPLPTFYRDRPDMVQIERVCSYIAAGNSMNKAFKHRDDPQHELYGIPAKSIFLWWVVSDDAARDIYARAKKAAGEHFAFRSIDIAEEVLENPSKERAMAARVAISGMQWAAEKLNRAEYGNDRTLTLDATSNFVKALERVEQARRLISKGGDVIDVTPDAATMRQVIMVEGTSD